MSSMLDTPCQKQLTALIATLCRSSGNNRDQYLQSPSTVQTFYAFVTTSHLDVSGCLSTTTIRQINPVARSLSQSLKVIVSKSRSDNSAELYGRILGASSRTIDRRGEARNIDLELGSPVQGLGLSNISLSSEEDEMGRVLVRDHGTGTRGLFLSVAGHEGHGEEPWVPKELHRQYR